MRTKNKQKKLSTKQLSRHRDEFMKLLTAQGYSKQTLRLYERSITSFCNAFSSMDQSVEMIERSKLEQLKEAVVEKTSEKSRTHARFCLKRFTTYLADLGVTHIVDDPPTDPLDFLRDEYKSYLRMQRGLSDATIYHCVRFLYRFMVFRFGDKLGDLNKITPGDIVEFLGQLMVGSRPFRDKTPPTHLRCLFRFLFWSGKTRKDLSASIPRVANVQPLNLPRYLKPEDVQRLIDSVNSDDALGRRNYAMLLLTARLGLRSPEVVAIQLGDIKWRLGEILIRGKGRLHDRMPLPSDAGESLVNYIKNDRKGPSRALFVSVRPPHKAIADGQIVNTILRKAFTKTGLKPPQRYVGSHILRHSLATDLLSNGASLDEVADVLRHRSRMTTTIYAKHDINALRSIAQQWPAQGGAR